MWLVPVFSLPAHVRKTRFWRPISPKLSGRPFFGVTMFAPSRFLSAATFSPDAAMVTCDLPAWPAKIVQKLGEEFQRVGKHGFDAAASSFGEVNKGLQAIAAEITDYTKK